MTPRRRFRFIRELAAGGFGKVYVAEMITTDNFSSVVAIKLLHGQWTTHEEIAQRARDEARLLGRLRHRNIVRVEDLTSIRGQAAVIMEYLEGVDLKSLSTYLTERGERMPLPATFEMIGAVASALEAAYNHVPLQGGEPLRLIHRDIKPSNVILTIAGDVKLLDFGTARANFEDREAKTQALAFGSQAYMAPERLLGDPDTPAGDIFSLGVSVYELLSGAAYGKIHIRPERYNRALDERLTQLDLEGQEPAIQDKVRRILGSMLSYDPDGRPSAAEVMEVMEVLAEEAHGPSIRRFARQAVTAAMQHNPHVPEDDELSGVTLFEDRSSSFDTEGLSDATVPPPEPEDYVSTPRPVPLAAARDAGQTSSPKPNPAERSGRTIPPPVSEPRPIPTPPPEPAPPEARPPLEAVRMPPALEPARTVYPDSLPAELLGAEVSEDVVRPGLEPEVVAQEPRPAERVFTTPPPEPVAPEPPAEPAAPEPPPEPKFVAPEPRPEPRPPADLLPPEPKHEPPPVRFDEPAPEPKKGKGALIGGVVALLLAVGVGVVALSGGGGGGEPSKPVQTDPKPPEPPKTPAEVKPPAADPPANPPPSNDPPPANDPPPTQPSGVGTPPGKEGGPAETPAGESGGLRLMVLPIGGADVSVNNAVGFKKEWDGGGARLDLSGLAKGTYRTKVSPKSGGLALRGTVNVESGKTCTYKIDLAAASADWQLVGCE